MIKPSANPGVTSLHLVSISLGASLFDASLAGSFSGGSPSGGLALVIRRRAPSRIRGL